MSKPVSGLNIFQAQSGPIPLSQLDANIAALQSAINDTGTYSNYFVDASGAANTITVTVAAPLTFAYVTGIMLQVKLANTNTSATVNLNVNALGSKTVINNDGTNPPIGSLVSGSILDLMYDGASFRLLRQSGTITTGLFGDGSAGSPSIAWASNPNTGLYKFGTNQVGIAANGVGLIAVGPSDVTFASSTHILNADGSAANPGYSFSSEATLGWYRRAAGNLTGGVGGVRVVEINASGLDIVPTTAMLTVPNGSAAAPSIAYRLDTNTGWYTDTADQIAIALGGVTAGQIAQGSFTGTLTGCTTAPTATIEWQLIGKHVVLFIPSLSATSNTTDLTITGVPAVIRSSGGTGNICCPFLTDNSVVVDFASARLDAASSAITFLRGGNANGFSAAGTKGTPANGVQLVYLAR